MYRSVISGEAGPWAAPIRLLLDGLSRLYGLAIEYRNNRYDRPDETVSLPVPVISVGNLTVGGTGKTPMVIDLVERLDLLGLSPAVVARGYKAIAGRPNDEQLLIQKHCPSLVYLVDSDRARGGELAIRNYGCDVVVLDDGFQHRKLARTLDIVLVDATCPFGHGHLLPRGLLREPARNLVRAKVVIITRCDQVSQRDLKLVQASVERFAADAVHLQASHKVRAIETPSGEPLSADLAGKRVVLVAGIANPKAFRSTVQTLDARIVAESYWPDHHAYSESDVRNLLKPGRFPQHDLILTTEKDTVKLLEYASLLPANLYCVSVGIDFKADGGKLLDDVLSKTLLTSISK